MHQYADDDKIKVLFTQKKKIAIIFEYAVGIYINKLFT